MLTFRETNGSEDDENNVEGDEDSEDSEFDDLEDVYKEARMHLPSYMAQQLITVSDDYGLLHS